MRSWVIGSRADCDVVVDSPLASGRHCQLTQTTGRLRARRPGIDQRNLRRRQSHQSAQPASRPPRQITIGQTVPMPWPPELAKFIRIGRIAGNDIVLDDPRVSSQHARLMIVGRFRCVDRGSRLLERHLSEFGRLPRDAADSASQVRHRLFRKSGGSGRSASGRLARTGRRLCSGAASPPQRSHAVPRPELPGRVDAGRQLDRGKSLAPGRTGPGAASGVPDRPVFGRHGRRRSVTDKNWTSVGQGIAATTFALAVAAVWLGCSLAVAASCRELVAEPPQRGRAEHRSLDLSRLAVLVSPRAWSGCALLWPSFTGGLGSKVRGCLSGACW